MKLRSATILLLLLIGAYAQLEITLDRAQQIATPYVYQGEQLDIKPQKLTTAGGTSYWVMEAKSLGQIQVMFPVDSKTGLINRDTSIKDVLKTHYLANFFATDDTIPNYLDGSLSFAQQTQADLDSKLTNFKTNVEPFMPANVTLTKKEPYKSAVSNAITRASSLRSSLTSMKSKISGINDPSDITVVQSGFSNLFSQETSFLNALDDVSTTSDALHTEVNQDVNAGTLDSSLGNSIILSTTHAGLSTSLIQRNDALTTNKNAMDSFFASLDSKADEYYVKLNNRLSSTSEELERKVILEKIGNYSSTYENISNSGNSLPSDYRISSGFNSDLQRLYNLLNKSYSDCSGDISTCRAVKSNYPTIDGLVTSLRADLSGYSGCTNGQTRACTAASGESGTQTCANNVWSTCAASGGGGGFNWLLIGGFLIIIVLLIVYRYRDKFFKGGEKVEPNKDYLSIYKR